MENTKALGLLKRSLDEILLQRIHPPDKKNYKLWYQEVCNILELTFGKNSREYDNFARAVRADYIVYTDEEKQEKYNNELDAYETALRAAIHKCELLEVEENVIENKEQKDIIASPIEIFDAMQFHPRIIEASGALFKDGHYRDAIYRAFVALNNFVKKKSALSPNELRGLKESQLMAKVFDTDNPRIKVNDLITDTDISEQEGFKFLFMGATIGIRNPKAHENILQTDPEKTLEYLALASLLMRRVEEGKIVKPTVSRPKWDWDKFLSNIKSGCDAEITDLAENLYNFTRNKSDSISWGTGTKDGSFTFRKLGGGKLISIFTMYSYGWIYISFSSMINKGVSVDTIELFREELNKIPNIVISKEAVISGYPRIFEKLLTNPENLKLFQDAVVTLCYQLDSEGAT